MRTTRLPHRGDRGKARDRNCDDDACALDPGCQRSPLHAFEMVKRSIPPLDSDATKSIGRDLEAVERAGVTARRHTHETSQTRRPTALSQASAETKCRGCDSRMELVPLLMSAEARTRVVRSSHLSAALRRSRSSSRRLLAETDGPRPAHARRRDHRRGRG